MRVLLTPRLPASRLAVAATARRFLTNPSTAPHAYLSELDAPTGQALSPEEDLSSIKCLVLNRPETKNALSVRMVGVSLATCIRHA